MLNWYNYPPKKNSFNQDTTNRSSKRTLWGSFGDTIKSFSTKDWTEFSDDYVSELTLSRCDIAVDMTNFNSLNTNWVAKPQYTRLIISIDGENNTTNSTGTSNDYWVFLDYDTTDTTSDGRTIFHFCWPSNYNNATSNSYFPRTIIKGPHVKFKLYLMSNYIGVNTILPVSDFQLFSHFLELYLIH